jgi:hypothetical protein
MIDDNSPTANLTDSENLDAILRRLAALEARVDDRVRETRPLLDQLIKEMTATRDMLMDERRKLRKQIEVMTLDPMEMRANQRHTEDRMDAIEQRPN